MGHSSIIYNVGIKKNICIKICENVGKFEGDRKRKGGGGVMGKKPVIDKSSEFTC